MCSLFLLLVGMLAVLNAPMVSAQQSAAVTQQSTGSSEASTPAALTANLCIIFYSKPGNVEYPWTTATSLTVTYNVSSTQPNTVNLISGSGTRTYTSKYGAKYQTSITLSPPAGYANNLLYTNGTVFDDGGIVYQLATPTQYPGAGALVNVTSANVYRTSAGAAIPSAIVEDPSFIIDNTSTSVTSTIPGFVSLDFVGCPKNPNCGNINTDTCTSGLTRSNGLVQLPYLDQLRAANKSPYNYSYFISDGSTWSTTANLTLTIDTVKAWKVTRLGDFYFTATNITGTRLYYCPLGTLTVAANAKNSTNHDLAILADQYIYPFAQPQQPSVYTSNNTAPLVDSGGLGYGIDVPTYGDGQNGNSIAPERSGTVGAYVYGMENFVGLMERGTRVPPNPQLQQQILL